MALVKTVQEVMNERVNDNFALAICATGIQKNLPAAPVRPRHAAFLLSVVETGHMPSRFGVADFVHARSGVKG